MAHSLRRASSPHKTRYRWAFAGAPCPRAGHKRTYFSRKLFDIDPSEVISVTVSNGDSKRTQVTITEQTKIEEIVKLISNRKTNTRLGREEKFRHTIRVQGSTWQYTVVPDSTEDSEAERRRQRGNGEFTAS